MDENIPVVSPLPAQPVPPQPQPATPVPVTPPQPSAPIEPVTPQIPKPKSKLFPLLLGVLVLAVLGLIGVFVYGKYISKPSSSPTPQPSPISSSTPTPDVTADWETYTDPNGKYLFKYPNDWDISLSIPNKMIAIAPQDRFKPGGMGATTASYFPISFSYDQLTNNLKTTPDKTEIVSQGNITVSGKEVLEYILKITELEAGFNLGDQYTRVIVPATDTTYFDFELFDSSYSTIFDQILSTFRFLK